MSHFALAFLAALAITVGGAVMLLAFLFGAFRR